MSRDTFNKKAKLLCVCIECYLSDIESVKEDAKKTQDQALELIDQLRKQVLTYEKEWRVVQNKHT